MEKVVMIIHWFNLLPLVLWRVLKGCQDLKSEEFYTVKCERGETKSYSSDSHFFIWDYETNFSHFSARFPNVKTSFSITDHWNWQWILHRGESGDRHCGHVARLFETAKETIYHWNMHSSLPFGSPYGHKWRSICLPGTLRMSFALMTTSKRPWQSN